MIEARPENALKCGMDLGEQAANAVAGLSDLGGEIIVEAAQHGESSERRVNQPKRVRRMWHQVGVRNYLRLLADGKDGGT